MSIPVTSLPVFNVDDFQVVARRRLRKDLYEYLASGTDDEQTLSENRSAFKLWYLRPRVMRPVSVVTTATELLGQRVEVPFFVSPAGVMALCDKDGECATARACGRIGTIFALSQHSTRSIEKVSQAAPNTSKWYQCYILKDRRLTASILNRAAKAGYRAIVLTVDSPRFGYREADARNGFNALPPPHRLVNYPDTSLLDETYNSKAHAAWDQNTEQMFETDLTWADVQWVKTQCSLPVIVKGIHTAEDAILAMEAGADGIMVSNHGGRQLDGALATIDILPEVTAVVQGRIPVFIDGGFRRGTDILKALALGASAVGLGKPIFFALALGGDDAVFKLFSMLKTELEAAMALCGCSSLDAVCPSLVTRHPIGGSMVRYQRAKL